MSSQPICLALVWHQHQPYYQELSRREALMPWVRLHAVKDYYDLPAKLRDYPAMHQTFNLVPSLLKQLRAYETGEVTDEYFLLSEKPAGQLGPAERAKLIERFFDAHRHWMIEPYTRYAELRRRREGISTAEAVRLFGEQDLLDLQVWFNLTWLDPIFKENDHFLKTLIAKGRGFTEQEKMQLLDKHREVLAKVIPIHQELVQSGQIELTTSPFYHPILPLLCNTEVARECMPQEPLPRPYRHPEDARAQIKGGLEYFESIFGFRPKGMWPSEGAVSQEALSLIAESGIGWVASDEDILGRSLGRPLGRNAQGDLLEPRVLYRPYRIETAAGTLAMVFRDHFLSDLIGFQYARSAAAEAAEHFLFRILRVRDRWPKGSEPPLVSVILDGENCWEYYPRDGHDFLDALYQRLSGTEEIRCVTVSEYLEQYPPKETLAKIAPGSWINHNFRVWIGHEEDNRSWDLLNDARTALQEATETGRVAPEELKKAWEEIYIAEGSDWNWWYGDEHSSGQDELFDELYRRHLMNVYRFLGREVPASLLEPVSAAGRKVFVSQPRNFISPTIDGNLTSYFEWQGAGSLLSQGAAGAMHQANRFLEELCFGFDLDSFYLRLGSEPTPGELVRTGHRFDVQIVHPGRFRLCIDRVDSFELWRREEEVWLSEGRRDTVRAGRILECAVTWRQLGLSAGQTLRFVVQLLKDDVVLETCPQERTIPVEVPDADFEAKMWIV